VFLPNQSEGEAEGDTEKIIVLFNDRSLPESSNN